MSQRSAVMAVRSFLRCSRWPLQVYCCGGGVRLWCWYVRRAFGFRGVIGMSLIERKDCDKTRMRGRKKNFKCYTCMCTHVHIYICVVIMRPMYLHLM